MSRFEFTMKEKDSKKRWTCKKNITFKIPKKKNDREHIETKKKTLKKIKKMSSMEKKNLLINNRIISESSSLPNSLVETILYTLV